MANRFDEVAKALAAGVSRRQALKILLGGAAGAALVGKGLQDVAAATPTPTGRNQYTAACRAECLRRHPTDGTNSAVVVACTQTCQGCTGRGIVNGRPTGGVNAFCGRTPGDGDVDAGDTDGDDDVLNDTCCSTVTSTGICDPKGTGFCQTATGPLCGGSRCPDRTFNCVMVSGRPTCMPACPTNRRCNGACCGPTQICGRVSGVYMCMSASSIAL